MKKILLFLLSVCVLICIVFFGVLPNLIDRHINKFTENENADIPALHQELFIADLHNDFLLWNRDLLEEHSYGHSDLPRLLKGNVALQVFSAVTKVPYGMNHHSNKGDSDMIEPLVFAQQWPAGTWFSLLERANYQALRLQIAAADSEKKLRIIRNRADLIALHLDRVYQPELLGGMLAIEGAHALEGDVRNIDELYNSGYRMIGLSHFFDTEFGGSTHGTEKHGLTEKGQALVKRMVEKNMLIDLAHASEAVFNDVVNIADVPLFISHTGVKGTCDTPRNLSDDQLRKVAASGGVVGITFFPSALCGADIKDIVSAILYTIKTIGVEHVAIGSDFDGAVSTPFSAKDLGLLTKALIDAGLSTSSIKAIMGENVLRLLLKSLPANRASLNENEEFMEYVF